MGVEQADLGNRSRADEAGVLVKLGAGFHATAAGDAARKRIGLFLLLHGHAGAGAKVVAAVNRDPGLYRFEIFEQDAAVDRQVANYRKLRKWLEPDGLFELVDQSRGRHAGASVDQHGAGAADFLETVGVVGDGRGGFAFAGDRVGGDLHER